MEFAGFAFWLVSKTREFLLPPFEEESWKTSAGWDKNVPKAIRSLYRAQNPNRQNHGKYDGMPPSTSGGLEDYTRDLTEMARSGQLEPVGLVGM